MEDFNVEIGKAKLDERRHYNTLSNYQIQHLIPALLYHIFAKLIHWWDFIGDLS